MADVELLTTQSIAAGANLTTKEIRLRDDKHVHALEYVVTGDGTVAITPYTTVGGHAWISNGVKVSATKTTGPGGDGKDIVPLTLKPGEMLRCYCEETGSADSVALTLWFTQK